MPCIGTRPLDIPKNISIFGKRHRVICLTQNDGFICRLPVPICAIYYPKLRKLFLKIFKDTIVTTKSGQSYRGLYRTFLSNMIGGLSKTFGRRLTLKGVGYRARISKDSKKL